MPVVVTDPIDQISEYKNLLIQNIPEIADGIYNKRKNNELIKCGLYFHHLNFNLEDAKKLMRTFDPREIHIFDRKEIMFENK